MMRVNTSIRMVVSASVIVFSIWALDGSYRLRNPGDPFDPVLVITAGVALVVAVAKFLVFPTAVRVRECLRFKPVKLAWTSITLNKRYSVDVKQIGNIYRDSFWKELVFTLTKPKAVVILNDTEFIREVLGKHKDLWGQWEYSENEDH